jgi:transaldolase
MMVVEHNCILLRDIFLATEGERGYVSLQVNPKNHFDGDEMVREVMSLYEELEDRLQGIPNVVFKLPATSAGLLAAGKLTQEGIGVTITVNFSVFQTLEFARVIASGNAPVSFIALMNGRVAYPIRDELADKGIEGGAEAAQRAGVEVARKSYRLMYVPESEGGMGINPGKVRLLIASLRNYDGWIPDISELWGCPVITIFPDIRRAFDERKREFRPYTIKEKTPDDALSILRSSEIFRQAWWVECDSVDYRPERKLSLDENESGALLEWPSVRNTLGQFISLYEEMGEKVKARMQKCAE